MILKKTIKNRLPEQLLSYYRLIRYKQLLRINQREKLTFEEAEQLISSQYLKTEGKELNWNCPETYTERISVVKLYGGNAVKTRLADKFLVREWIKNKIGEKYLIPLIGTYTAFTEIDFERLPERFVVKCNHDCSSVFICKNKKSINKHVWSELKQRFDFYCKRNYAYSGFEMHYKFISPKILIEDYVGENNKEIEDYKFYCFDGKPYYCEVIIDRFTNIKSNVYDLDWNLQPFQFVYDNSLKLISRPLQFELMKNIASTLCKGFDQVRIDLYSVHDKVYFGEMTFTTASGLLVIKPSKYDKSIGRLWQFDNDSIQDKRKRLKNISVEDYKYETIDKCDCTCL